MCQIIEAKPGVVIPEWLLEEAAYYNDDGWGVMWPRDGQLVTARGMDMEVGKRFVMGMGVEEHRVVHFRWGTHGEKALGNTHPFEVAPHVAMMHNGVCPLAKEELGIGESDTAALARLLKEAAAGFGWRQPGELLEWTAQQIVEVDQTSRYLVMAGSGEYVKLGEWCRLGEGLEVSTATWEPGTRGGAVRWEGEAWASDESGLWLSRRSEQELWALVGLEHEELVQAVFEDPDWAARLLRSVAEEYYDLGGGRE